MFEELNYTFAEFVRDVVATPEEWQEWEQVRAAQPPQTRPVLPVGRYDQFYHEQLPTSPEFERKQDLRDQFVERARELMLSGEWEVTGRRAATDERRALEPVDIVAATLDFSNDAVGSYAHVRIRRARPESNFEVMKQFIETACQAIGQPRRKATKELINDLAQAFRKESHSLPAFAAAWEEANIGMKWSKPGP